MRKHGTWLGCVAALVAVSAASAQNIDSARLNLRVFNDDPDSSLSTTNLYPSQITILDEMLNGDGSGDEFTNRHNFRLSENGGISDAVFLNDSAFSISADITITGPANSEGGLNVSPWWSQQVDGVFMINAASGEVAVFGGRLPFYSFTANHGVSYVKGETITQSITYDPNSLTELDPATIQYTYTDSTGTYVSPVLAFDMGNPDEDPPYGLWGILNDARVGGYFQPQINTGDPENWGQVDFTNIKYVPEPASLVLLGLGAVALVRRK